MSDFNVEKDRAPVKALVIFLVVVTSFILVAVIGLNQLLWFGSHWRQQNMELQSVNTEINELRAKDKQELSTYEKLEKDYYRIPIERSMELMIKKKLF